MKRLHSPLPPLFLVIFIDTFGYFLVLPVILRLFIHTDSSILPLETSMVTRQWLYSITLMLSPLAFISLSPFAGHLSDAFGRKKVIATCLIASLVGFILPIIGIVTHRISLIMLGRFIAGAGTTSQPVAQAAITDFSTGKARAFNLSLIGLSMTLAMVVGPLSGGYLSDTTLVHWFNPTTPYWAGTVLAVINLALLWRYFNESHITTQHNSKSKSNTSLLRLITKPILYLLLTFLSIELAWSAFYQGSFLFLGGKLHFTTNQISEFAAYAGFWMCLGLTVVYKFWLKTTSVNQITRISLVVMTAGFVGLCLTYTTISLWVLIAPIALCTGTAYPSLLQLISNNTSSQHQGWMLGIASTLLGFAWMITGLFSAVVIRQSVQLLLWLCAAVIGLAFLIVFRTLSHND